jgi:ABC-2 type transport system permease protein
VSTKLKIYAVESKYEAVRLLRSRSFVLFIVGMPLLFYAIFSQAFGGSMVRSEVPAQVYMVATFGSFGVIGMSMFSFGVVIASERTSWLLLKRASPMPPEAYLLAKLVVALVVTLAYVILLYLIAAIIGGARLTAIQYLRVGIVLLLGTIPFGSMGFALAYSVRDARTAQSIANALHMPMAFAAGLWVPLEFLPGIFRTTAPLFPHYHFCQLSLAQITGSLDVGQQAIHVAVLIGYSLVFFGLALFGYKRDQAILNS